MKAKITIEYELPWPVGLTLAELREREEEAWMTGAIAIRNGAQIIARRDWERS